MSSPDSQLFQPEIALSPAHQAALLRFAGLVLESQRGDFTDLPPELRLHALVCGLIEPAGVEGQAMQETSLGEAALLFSKGPF